MLKKRSPSCYGKYEEGGVRQYLCVGMRKFLQNRKSALILLSTVLVSTAVGIVCMNIDKPAEYFSVVEEKSDRIRQERKYASAMVDGKINIAVADAKTLCELDGIGEVLAEEIIACREKEPFQTVEDIVRVSGIGWAKFERIKDKITLGKE